MSPAEQVAEGVRALERLDLEGVRAEWRKAYGPPPKLRSVDLLRRILAWRMQAKALGDLDTQTRRRLRQPPAKRALGPTPRPGARIAREYQGRVYEVEVVEGGFAYLGHRYKSLSQIASLITGTRWNGPRFFGLRGDPA